MGNFVSKYFDNFSNAESSKGNLGDFQHASRLYIDNNMRLAPKFSHLFHVVLNINPKANVAALNSSIKYEINLFNDVILNKNFAALTAGSFDYEVHFALICVKL